MESSSQILNVAILPHLNLLNFGWSFFTLIAKRPSSSLNKPKSQTRRKKKTTDRKETASSSFYVVLNDPPMMSTCDEFYWLCFYRRSWPPETHRSACLIAKSLPPLIHTVLSGAPCGSFALCRHQGYRFSFFKDLKQLPLTHNWSVKPNQEFPPTSQTPPPPPPIMFVVFCVAFFTPYWGGDWWRGFKMLFCSDDIFVCFDLIFCCCCLTPSTLLKTGLYRFECCVYSRGYVPVQSINTGGMSITLLMEAECISLLCPDRAHPLPPLSLSLLFTKTSKCFPLRVASRSPLLFVSFVCSVLS